MNSTPLSVDPNLHIYDVVASMSSAEVDFCPLYIEVYTKAVLIGLLF